MSLLTTKNTDTIRQGLPSMKKLLFAIPLCFAALIIKADVIDLSGNWNISYRDNSGSHDTVISLPGSMLTNGLGNIPDSSTKWTGSLYDLSYYYSPRFEKYRKPGNIKFPFFLTPDREFVGKADYSRNVEIPASWEDKEVFLYIERPHIETKIYINDRAAGHDSTLSVPHKYNITPYLKFGDTNDIKIEVYNGIENVNIGQDSHSVTDQTQGNWNGMAGLIEIISYPKTHISNLKIFPDIQNKSVDVKAKISNPNKEETVTLIIDDETKTFKNQTVDPEGFLSLNLPIKGDVKLWDEFNPNLYTLKAILNGDTVTKTFGFRDFTIEDRQFYINGRPIWLRGTVENCCFPLTGYPPTDVESWLKIFGKCKEYGLNHVRFHSYCPPEAAFEAADQLGLYLQPEGPSWPNHGVTLGEGMSTDRYLMEETRRMVDEYGNHPSFTMLCAGNEPAGNWVEWVGDFVNYWKSTGDNRRVYCGASVGGGWAWDPKSEYHVKGGARGLTWSRQRPSSNDDFAEDMQHVVQKGRTQTLTFDVTEPRVGHEIGQWCVFPDFKEIDQYKGPYKALNFEIFKESLEENGMAGQTEKFLKASGNLQTLAYKYDIERNLRTPDYSGFQMLSLNDYSGQGTALVGVLNVFFREKGYCDGEDWRQFCSPIVPLAEFPKFVFTDDETLTVPVQLYNASDQFLKDVPVSLILSGNNGFEKTLISNQRSFEIGKNIPVQEINLPLRDLTPGKYTLTADVGDARNSWDFWVYPSSIEMPDSGGIHISDTFDAKCEEVLKNGGKVLLTAAGKVRYGNDIVQHYLPVFWNTSWFKMAPPHTTGAVIDTEHPLFKEFESDDWSNLNWWELLNRAQVINLTQFPKGYQPPVQPIDTWHLNRKIGMIVEGNMYDGKLLMTTMDIDNLEDRPVAREMRKAILAYMNSDDFKPSLDLTPDLIRNLFENEAEPVLMYTNESPDELKPVIN